MRVLLVALGGGVGAVLRYWLGGLVQTAVPTAFPVGTLVVNVLGCFVIGAFAELGERRGILTPEVHALLVVGLLGGFTTFSAFANDTVSAARAGLSAVALANIGLSVVLCVAAVWLGRTTGARLS